MNRVISELAALQRALHGSACFQIKNLIALLTGSNIRSHSFYYGSQEQMVVFVIDAMG
jgi:hypothetical protein